MQGAVSGWDFEFNSYNIQEEKMEEVRGWPGCHLHNNGSKREKVDGEQEGAAPWGTPLLTGAGEIVGSLTRKDQENVWIRSPWHKALSKTAEGSRGMKIVGVWSLPVRRINKTEIETIKKPLAYFHKSNFQWVTKQLLMYLVTLFCFPFPERLSRLSLLEKAREKKVAFYLVVGCSSALKFKYWLWGEMNWNDNYKTMDIREHFVGPGSHALIAPLITHHFNHAHVHSMFCPSPSAGAHLLCFHLVLLFSLLVNSSSLCSTLGSSHTGEP